MLSQSAPSTKGYAFRRNDHSMNRRVWMTGLIALVALVGCGGARSYWAAQPIAVQGLVIQPFEVYARGRLLNVRANLTNQGSLPVIVDRDAVTLVLPNGRVISRSQGTFTQHSPYVVPPGATHPVF